MRRLNLILCVASLGLASAACTPITALQGYQAIDVKPGDIKVGDDSKQTVRVKLVKDWLKSIFDPKTRPWYREEFVHPRDFPAKVSPPVVPAETTRRRAG